MTAEDVERALDALREAGARLRARPAAEVHAVLGRALDVWCDAGSAWRAALARDLPVEIGMGAAMVKAGLESGLAPYSGAALRELVVRELGGATATGFDTTGVVLAGSLPMPSFVALLAPLALRSAILVKPASRDGVTPRHIANSLAEIDRGLGECLVITGFARDDDASTAAFCKADCVVASGSDETISALAARTRPGQRFVGYGHRLSVAVVGDGSTRGAALAELGRGLAVDVALWDQLGCLSPVGVYVTSPDERAAERVARALADALAHLEKSWPRGPIPREASAAIGRERSAAEMRIAAGRTVGLYASDDTAWTVVREDDSRLRPAPLHRFVRVHPVQGRQQLLQALQPIARHLAGVAVAGFESERSEVAAQLTGLGASRVCSPGLMQAPPLAWRRDNRGVLEPLARFTAHDIADPRAADRG